MSSVKHLFLSIVDKKKKPYLCTYKMQKELIPKSNINHFILL